MLVHCFAHCRLPGAQSGTALAQQGLCFACRYPRKETGSHLESGLVPVVTAEHRAQELLKHGPATRGDRVDQALTPRTTRTGLGLQVDRALLGQTRQQVVERRLLEIRVDRAMRHQDAVQFIAVPGTGVQDTEHHQHAGCLGEGRDRYGLWILQSS